jgi:hypothetical protein
MSELTPAKLALLKLGGLQCEVMVVGMVELEDGAWSASEGVGLAADHYDVVIMTHDPKGDLLDVIEVATEVGTLYDAEAIASRVAAQLLDDATDYVVSV